MHDEPNTTYDPVVCQDDLHALRQQIADLHQQRARAQQELDALRAERDYLRVIADYSTNWDYWRAPDGRLHYVSATCESITGYTVAAFQADPELLIGIVHPEDREPLAHHLHNEHHLSSLCEMEFRIITRSGEVRWISHTCQPVYGRDGAWQGQRASNRDITACKQTEEAYRTLVETSLQAFVIFQDGHTCFANPATTHITGYSHDELLAMSPEEATQVVYPDDRALLAERARLCQQGEDVPSRYEFRLIRKDGAVRWVECFSVRTLYRGNPAVQMTYIDITERKQAEEARHFQAQLLDSAGQAIIATRLDGIITYWNAAAEQLYGWSKAEAIGQSVLDATLAQPVFAEPGEIIARIKQGESWAGEFLAQHRNGRTFPAWVCDVPFRDAEGNVIGVIGVSMDISERKQAEAALRESEARYRTLAENFPGTVFLFDLELRYLVADGQELAMIGMTPAMLEGKTLHEATPPEIAAIGDPLYRAVLAGTAPAELEQHYGNQVYRTHPIALRNNQDQIVAGMIISQNITERKEAEEALRVSEVRFRTLIDHLPDSAVFLVDHDLRLLVARGQGVIKMGWNPDLLEGKTLQECLPPDTYASVVPIYQAALTGTAPAELEQSWHDHTYHLRPLSLRNEHGVIVAAMILAQDITERKQAEAALRENRALLQGVLDHAPVYIFAKDLQGHLTLVNRQLAGLFQVGTEEMIGKTDYDFHPPKIAAHNWAIDLEVQRTRQPVEHEEYKLDADGTHSTYLSIKFPLFHDDGTLIGTCGIATDITERKQAEAALQESEARLLRGERIAHLGSWETDIATGKAVWSDEFFRICGFEPGSFMPTNELGLQCIHPDDRAMAIAHVQRAIEQQIPYDIEKRIVRPDGTIRRVHSIGEVICDAHQQPITLSGAFLDITERKEAEEAVQRQQRFLRQVIDSIPAIICVRDRQGRFTLVNQTLAAIYGTTVEALLGSTDADMHLAADELAQIQREDAHVLDSGEELVIPERHISDASGQTRYLSISKHPLLLTDGPADQVLVVASDITKRKHLELELQHTNTQLREQAIRDALTRLYNRRYLDETLPREVQRASRQGHSIGVIMLDIDHFKRLNDTHGHDAGDTVLRMMGAFLKEHSRSEDIACRYGGEEFTLVMPGATQAATQQRAEALRVGIARLRITHQGRALAAITVSLGVAVFPVHGTTAEAIITAADQALYQAKRNGRNRAEVAG